MTVFKYPFPIRRLVESADSVKNIGFAQGVFSDGRPFHAECWAEDGATHLTFFFSVIGIEDYQKADIINYLANEGVIELIEGMPCYCGVGILKDGSNNRMFSATVTIGDEDGIFVKSAIPLHKWGKFME